jgi:hypothetical protein
VTEESTCLKCHQPMNNPSERWCASCWYPGIDDDYQRFIDLLEDGHRATEAAFLSGWDGADILSTSIQGTYLPAKA